MLRKLPLSLWGVLLLAGTLGFSIALTAQKALLGSSKVADTGQEIFRFDTFGNEPFWTDTLRLHEVIEQAVSPLVALSVGLKVDASVLPPNFLATHSLTSPATTVQLLALDAVVGLKADVNGSSIERIGITCAICHSTVDDSVIPGVGLRRDGWANTDLDPGAIIALSPALSPAQKAVYNSWGPGMYDPRFNLDGINLPVVIPPAYGLRGVDLETYTGDGALPYWNNYVAVTQMQGQGIFIDRRIGVKVIRTPDLVHPKLHPLMVYQFTLATPAPPAGSFDPAAAARGQAVFNTSARCASCHIPPLFTDINLGIWHRPEETGMEPVYASRSATKLYRTTPLRALWQHAPYFHDGSAATLDAVVEHYNTVLGLGLTAAQKSDLVAYLKSL
jgi:mono/diheme cytochrome c family protein